MMSNRIQFAICSHPGKKRKNNEDNFYLNGVYRRDIQNQYSFHAGKAKDSMFLAAVCDGMGGIAYGELASLYTVESLVPASIDRIQEVARFSVSLANDRICEELRRKKGVMSGSTLTALYIDQGYAIACNIGDSRCYLYREKKLYQLTTDHSRAQYLFDRGKLTDEQLRTDKSRHQLMRYIGVFPEEMKLEPDFSDGVLLQKGDSFLLCSDGLSDMLEDEKIGSVIGGAKKPDHVVKKLVELALEKGGLDNITCILLQI